MEGGRLQAQTMEWLEDYLELTDSAPMQLKDMHRTLVNLETKLENMTNELSQRMESFNSSLENWTLKQRKTEYAAIQAFHVQVLETADEKVLAACEFYKAVDAMVVKTDRMMVKLKDEITGGVSSNGAELGGAGQQQDEPRPGSSRCCRGRSASDGMVPNPLWSAERKSLEGKAKRRFSDSASTIPSGSGSTASTLALTMYNSPAAEFRQSKRAEKPKRSEGDLEIVVESEDDETRYCHCNDLSYGAMVACDNKDCKIEWFHFNCVGLDAAPKGAWYCLDCAAAMSQEKEDPKKDN